MNFLIDIPGPQFILLFIVYGVFVILLVRYLIRNDSTSSLPMPDPTHFSPYELAFLKGGARNLITTVATFLWHNKLIEMHLGSKKVVRIKSGTNKTDLSTLDKTVLNFIDDEITIKKFYSKELVYLIGSDIEAMRGRLESKRMLVDDETMKHIRLKFWLGFIAIFTVGGLKLNYGLLFEKPVGFLIVLLPALLFVYYRMLNPAKNKVTALGRKLVAFSETRFQSNKSSYTEERNGGDDMFYTVALFGAAASFSGGTDTPNVLEQNRNWSSGSSSGGCTTGVDGGGCSGSSDGGGSDGGSGCSGGSGCGGCGGGGD